MNTSTELRSTQVLRPYVGDINVSIEPSSSKSVAPERPAPEQLHTISVAGTGDTTAVTRMVAHVAEYMDVAAARTTTGSLLIELDREGTDVAVFMDAGGDDAEDPSEVRRIQSLASEAARTEATLILNADDPHLRTIVDGDALLAQRAPRRVVYFSMSPTCPTTVAHREAGGIVYLLRDGWIVETNGASEKKVVRITDLPMTMGGAARAQVASALAAVAAARTVGFGLAEILCGLRTFESPTPLSER